MADRTVKVTLTAHVSQYLTGMEEAAKATRETGTEAEKLAQKKQAFQELGAAAVAFGAVTLAAVGLAIAKAAQFDEAMSQVNAALQESTENQALLRDAALEAGGRTVYSATEAANAIEELGKAGISTADILGGALDGALDLAASGQLEVARAAEITATTLKQFKLEGDQAAHVADVLSAGAGKALGSVEDLANGLKFVGPQAQAMGISLEETTGVLSLFADQGILGEQAGTSLRGMLMSLTSPSGQARSEMERLGISLYDAEGNFLGLEHAAGQLSGAYDGMDQASRDASVGILFGNAQITAANALMSEGADGVRDYTAAVDDTGYATRVAADRLDNLAGDVEKLGGAFETGLIKAGESASESLRGLVQMATSGVEAFSNLPTPVMDSAVAVATVIGAVALVGGAAMIAVPKIADFKNSMETLGVSGKTVAGNVAKIATALTIATVLLSAFANAQAEADARARGFADTLEQGSGRVTEATKDMLKEQLSASQQTLWWTDDSVYSAAEKLGLSLETVTQAALGNKDALAEVAAVTDVGVSSSEELKARADELGLTWFDLSNSQAIVKNGLEDVSAAMTEGEKIALQKADADTKAADQAAEHEQVLHEMSGAAGSATDVIDGLSDAIRGLGDTTLDARAAERDFYAAIQDVTDAVAENGTSLDITTEAGRANQEVIDSLAQAAKDRAAAILDETGSQELATQALYGGRDALIAQLAQFGIVGPEAEAYADKLGLIPTTIDTYVDVKTDDATTKVDNFVMKLGSIPGSVTSTIEAVLTGKTVNERGGFYEQGVRAFETGGITPGFYSGRRGGIHKFAEESLPWELYMSPKPGYERQNIGYALEGLSRLGVDLGALGGGGMRVDVGGIEVKSADPHAAAQLLQGQLGAAIARWSR